MPNFSTPTRAKRIPRRSLGSDYKTRGLWCWFFGEPVAEPIAICGTRQHGLRNSKSDETINRTASERWRARGGQVCLKADFQLEPGI